VPFRPENCYGAPDTWLWKVAEEDQVAADRREQCRSAGDAESLQCHGAAMGHPNVRGAQEYANAITRELGRFLPEWRQTFGAVGPRRTLRIP
jgi:hypothetical protein